MNRQNKTQLTNKSKSANSQKELSISQTLSISPIPSPEELAKYREVGPTLVDTIVGMAVKEQEFRHKITKSNFESITYGNRYGQFLASLLVIGCLGASVALGFAGAYAAASLVGGTTTLGVLYQMLRGPKKQENTENKD